MIYFFSVLALYLALYSFLGWVAEVLDVFVTTRRLQNRGFLTGPFLPIYGFGAILLLFAVYPYINNPFLVFLASVAITSALEFFTHLVLDKAFHIKLWDYTGWPFNIQGRICLQNSLAFGALGLLLLYVIRPFATSLISHIPQSAAIALAGVLLGILVIDAANSIRTLAKVRPVLDHFKGTLGEAHSKIEQTAEARYEALNEMRTAPAASNSGTLARLVRAFPQAKSNKAAIVDPRTLRGVMPDGNPDA